VKEHDMSNGSFVVKTMLLDIDAKEYACDITGLREVPNTPLLQTATACPDGVASDTGQTTWSLEVQANVSLEDDSLWEVLNDPAKWGKIVTAKWAPDATNHPTKGRTAQIVLVPPGGDFTVNSWATFQVSFPVKGHPTNTVLTPATQPVVTT
jgi:hypothetical protein